MTVTKISNLEEEVVSLTSQLAEQREGREKAQQETASCEERLSIAASERETLEEEVRRMKTELEGKAEDIQARVKMINKVRVCVCVYVHVCMLVYMLWGVTVCMNGE